jgi:hypothetical protein
MKKKIHQQNKIKKKKNSNEYREIYEKINSDDFIDSLPMANLKTKWCLAKFQDEWFR